MKLAFVSGLSDKKLSQKLLPLQALEEVDDIQLYRRHPYYGKKIHWINLPRLAQQHIILGDLLRFLLLVLRSRHYDILIGCHQGYHGLMVYLCGRIWRKPVVQIVISEIDRICKNLLLKHALLAADACTVRGPKSCKRLRQVGYRGRIDILPNPYTLPTKTADTAISERYYDLAVVGDYAKAKAYPWMMQVLAGVTQKRPDLKVAVVGRGPYKEKLASYLFGNDLNHHIEFLGWKDEKGIDAVYRNSKAFLLTSRTEGLPMVVLEAMSYRLPVFVTAVGDLTWLVRDGEEGRIIPYGETREMSEAIVNALKNSDMLEEMGERAYARIVSLSQQFAPEVITRIWSSLLNFVTQKGYD